MQFEYWLNFRSLRRRYGLEDVGLQVDTTSPFPYLSLPFGGEMQYAFAAHKISVGGATESRFRGHCMVKQWKESGPPLTIFSTEREQNQLVCCIFQDKAFVIINPQGLPLSATNESETVIVPSFDPQLAASEVVNLNNIRAQRGHR